MIQFKTPEIESQYHELPLRNPRLNKFLTALSLFCELEFKRDIVLTCIYRDDAENQAVGGILGSPHLTWEAVDLRSSTFAPAEIEHLAAWANELTYRNGKPTCIHHAVQGGAFHFHIQVAKP